MVPGIADIEEKRSAIDRRLGNAILRRMHQRDLRAGMDFIAPKAV